ncbi:carbohydrate ABC transporter substrate-binding protein, CUT1 family [Sanguibacter gelidistatuariae]|uniref:Carbohydrate ABC transporter substrate-binding protein, CUT1 family n=1 Tax=Sanguibacter gelidistatuariae TaxID=1814289 RepID=A0A1G6UEX4_9MICO|nr:extracellular solute-binding protein [Sanguibacter gelidistatuariae]SDD39791.1 carbohydrate ABC transporter substrate-binding protein, CUT1 family [Sanguibacter gelidistatuariae]
MKSKTTRMRKASAFAASVVGMSMVLAACGSSTPGESAKTDGGDGSATTIEFWHRTFTPVENEWYAQVVKDFNASQSAIKVVDTEVPADTWDQKMKAAQAAGKAPDVYTYSGALVEQVDAGQFHALEGIVPQDKLDEILPSAQSISQVDGSYYAYPLLLEPQAVLFWNKDMLDAAGVDSTKAPATWDDLYAACAKIVPTLSEGQYCISPAADAVTLAWASAGQQYNAAGHLALTQDWTAPDIDNQGYRDIMGFYKELYDQGYMPKQPLGSYLEAKDYGEKKVAFKVSGSWMMSEVGSDYSDLLDVTGLGPVPTSPNGDGRTTTTAGNFMWVVDAKSDNPDAAGEFLSWVLAGDPEVLVPFFVDTQFTKSPVRQSVQDAVAKTEAAAAAPWSSVIVNDIAPDAHPGATYPWDISLAVGTAIESAMKSAQSIDDAIGTASGSIDTIIQRESLPEKAPKP